MKRALFKWPKRVIGKDITIPGIVAKIQSWFGRSHFFLLIFSWSIIFLLYAFRYNYQKLQHTAYTTDTIIWMHNADYNTIDNSDTKNNTITTDILDNNTSDIMESWEEITSKRLRSQWTVQKNTDEDAIMLLYTLYESINNNNYDSALYFDNYMRSSDFVRRYFWKKSIDRLVSHTINGLTIYNISTDSDIRDDKLQVSYNISYTLSDNQQVFKEYWVVTLRNQWWWKIATMRCETKWCSTHPIFQQSRYGIK